MPASQSERPARSPCAARSDDIRRRYCGLRKASSRINRTIVMGDSNVALTRAGFRRGRVSMRPAGRGSLLGSGSVRGLSGGREIICGRRLLGSRRRDSERQQNGLGRLRRHLFELRLFCRNTFSGRRLFSGCRSPGCSILVDCLGGTLSAMAGCAGCWPAPVPRGFQSPASCEPACRAAVASASRSNS